MNYWDSNVWIFVFAAWLAILSFSRDPFARVSAIFWLLACNVGPIALDHIEATAFRPSYGFTFNGLLAAVFCVGMLLKNKMALIYAFLCVCATNFIFVLMHVSGSTDRLENMFFGISYFLEFVVVTLSMGWRFDTNRIINYCSRMGRGVHDNRQRAS